MSFDVDFLVELEHNESAKEITRMANSLHQVFSHREPSVTCAAASVLGKLAKLKTPLLAELLENELKRALEWIEDSKINNYSALLILGNLAANAPSIFYIHAENFLGLVWLGLHDKEVLVREAAAYALRACLSLLAARDASNALHQQWYQRLFSQAMQGFSKNQSAEVVHGSLLCLDEMLQNTGEFMLSRYKQVCDTVFKYWNNSNKMIKKMIMSLLPVLSNYNSHDFSKFYLSTAMNLLMTSLKKESDRSNVFLAIGGIAIATGKEMKMYLEPIVSYLKGTLNLKNTKFSSSTNEALKCISMLSKSIGPDLNIYIKDLLNHIFQQKLTETLVETLGDLVEHVPSLSIEIQIRLMDMISLILDKKHFKLPGTGGSIYTKMNPHTPTHSSHEDPQLIKLALYTLGSFNFISSILTEFLRDCVVKYLTHDSAYVRYDAVTTCCKLMIPHLSSNKTKKISTRGYSSQIVNQVLERVLIVSIADINVHIRKAVLEHLYPCFDVFLSQPEKLAILFKALNDESFEIRSLTVSVLCRLSSRNPAYVLPALRSRLIQLLSELEYTEDSLCKEQSARLLSQLISGSKKLCQPYATAIFKVLLEKVSDPDTRVAAQVMEALGQLSRVSNMLSNLDKLLPIIIETLQDQSSPNKRKVALTTLGHLIQSTGYVITPLLQYPKLLETLLNIIKTEQSSDMKYEVSKVLGILGALDPDKQRQNQLHHQKKRRAAASSSRADPNNSQVSAPNDSNDPALDPSGAVLTPSQEEYYPTCAINALLGILRDPSLSLHHQNVVQAIMFMFKSLGLKCIPYFRQIMPSFLLLLNSSEQRFKEFLFQQLALLVSIVKQYIREYLDDIFKLIKTFWNTNLIFQIASLIEEIVIALNDEFRAYMPLIIPLITLVFNNDQVYSKKRVIRLIQTVQVFSTLLDDYKHVVIPSIVSLMDFARIYVDIDVAIAAIKCIGSLSIQLDLRDFVSRIVHPLNRALEHACTGGTTSGTTLSSDSLVSSLSRELGGSSSSSGLVLSQSTSSLSTSSSSVSSTNMSTSTTASQDLVGHAVKTLSVLLAVMKEEFIPFLPTIRKFLNRFRISDMVYEELEQTLKKSVRDSSFALFDMKANELITKFKMAEASRVNSGESFPVSKLKVSEQSLKRAWETSQRSTKEDWAEWMRKFSIELLRESPSPALRSCLYVTDYFPIVKLLFNAGFVSCWNELSDTSQRELVRALETALLSNNIPQEILQNLLDLAEFMEHDDHSLPIDVHTLAVLSEKCRAYAKALHYRELEYKQSPNNISAIESLISINNKLGLPYASIGILTYAQEKNSIELKESWYEKLGRWEEALEAYSKRSSTDRECLLGRMRCLNSLGEWEVILNECWPYFNLHDQSDGKSPRIVRDYELKQLLAPLACSSAWYLQDWDKLKQFVIALDKNSPDYSFYMSIIHLHSNNFEKAQLSIYNSRGLLDTELTALFGESYQRAYTSMVRVQQLSELEEVIDYKQGDPEERLLFRKIWNQRLKGCQRDMDIWRKLLAIREMVIPPHNDLESWIEFATLCRKTGKLGLAKKILIQLSKPVVPSFTQDGLESREEKLDLSRVRFAQIKLKWAEGKQEIAHQELRQFAASINSKQDGQLYSRVAHLMGTWIKMSNETLEGEQLTAVINEFRAATKADPNWYKAWHSWAIINHDIVNRHLSKGQRTGSSYSSVKLSPELIANHLVPAINGFLRSIALSPGHNLQDILRLLTLWFEFGNDKNVEAALEEGFNALSIDFWLPVIPQIIARIHSPNEGFRRLLVNLLNKIGKEHPQALVYPLMVASKTQSSSQGLAPAKAVIDKMRLHSPALVDQAVLVSQELIRVAILWHEMWYEGLEEASKRFFGDKNVNAMLAVLAPLHKMLEKGPETIREASFHQAFGHDLQEASDWCKKYMTSKNDTDINRAWDVYYQVFRRINKQMPQMTVLELKHVSPSLLESRNMDLAVPGTYKAGKPVIHIAKFSSVMKVITSKQRPRKLNIIGGDGLDYNFLLKGHEDLRQDERVMQLFGLVNTLLRKNLRTRASMGSMIDLSIQQYAVVPLSPNSGLIGWVPHSDTLHQLIREYRHSRNIPLNLEHRHMLRLASDYDNLALMQKVEVFEHALESTNGMDLERILWLKSPNSEVWLERRTNYTTSLAVMSIVGYILGLGDRHPSNLMLDRHTGKIIHIDFGDCFEVAMNREKFPEKIPFRLTRMLVNAMEVSGIEGNFRIVCENVMTILRQNKESLMAVLEAFVHDPLINWRLLTTNTTTVVAKESPSSSSGCQSPDLSNSPSWADNAESIRSSFSSDEINDISKEANDIPKETNEVPTNPDQLNERALSVIDRVSNKLSGRDFDKDTTLSPKEQVNKLIIRATSRENLCQCYIGWCPFW